MFPFFCFIVLPNYLRAQPEINFSMELVFLFVPNTINCEICALLSDESSQQSLLKEKIRLRKTSIT